MKGWRNVWVFFFIAGGCLGLNSRGQAAGDYDLSAVKGMEGFRGSSAARELLAKNGFVVADPSFKQIFEPYIESPQTGEPSEKHPMGQVLPAFITTDSAWHTYHVLLEEGVKELELVQAHRLRNFSAELLTLTRSQSSQIGPGAEALAEFASVGFALQDAAYRESLPAKTKRIVEELRSGSAPVVVPIGFELSPLLFRAQSVYTQSPELSDYFAARQWYASVVFRLRNDRETKLALALASRIEANPKLLASWKQLSDPFDAFLAPAEDGTVREYAETIRGIVGGKPVEAGAIDAKFAEIRKKLGSRLPLPKISDQLLSPEEYSQFQNETRGFRLLPPRQLPCAVTFQDTTDPKIRGRAYPSGLDFLAASPVLRSPAAVRAVRSQFGAGIGDLISKAECGPMPDSLHGEAMNLLATLQKPLPSRVPAALRTAAWSDLQLWTQLGAWAEQRHTWALHSKLSVTLLGIITPPQGMVAPYPEFFSGLARLTRRTAAVFATNGMEQRFEVKAVANDLLQAYRVSQDLATRVWRQNEYNRNNTIMEHLGQFQNLYFEKHRAEIETGRSRETYVEREQGLVALANRCAANGTTNESEVETLRLFFDCRQNIVRLLNDFAPVCDRLTELAKKSLTGQALTEADAQWIRGYGVTLAGFHFYYGNSYEVPRDDFPIATRVFSNPLRDSMLYAGLARPQALYLIATDGKTQQLYRGAVLTYREFVRPNDQLLDDESWRAMISKGQIPPAPPFTRSFYAETSVAELIKTLRSAEDEENANYRDTRDLLWQIGSSATEKDLTLLYESMVQAGENSDVTDGLAEIISRLPWESRQQDFVSLLTSTNNSLANASARILLSRPAVVGPEAIISAFATQPPRARRLACVILSRLPQHSDAMHGLLLKALRDPVDGVRWQAVLAIKTAGWNDTKSSAALLETLSDTNELVGAAAAYSLSKLGASNAAPMLFTKLKERLQLPTTAFETMSPQVLAIVQDTRGEENHADEPLNVDHLTLRLEMPVTSIMKRGAGMRSPPMPVHFSLHNYNLADALIEALGELKYAPAADELFKLRGSDYDTEATLALNKIASDRLTDDLIGTARDKQIDSYLREKALVTLANLSATNRIRDLVPLLEDPTPIVYTRTMPGAEWRVCDRAAVTIAVLAGLEDKFLRSHFRSEEVAETMRQVRAWVQQAASK